MRKITCPKCGELRPTPPEDAALGLFERRVHGSAIRSLSCDYCGKPIDKGDSVIALSSPPHMPEWESDYLIERRDSDG